MTNDEFLYYGMIVMDYLVVFFLVLTAVVNLVVLRDKYIPEPDFVSSGRRMIIAGYVLLSSWYVYKMLETGDLPISFPTGLSLLLLSLGSLVVITARLHRRYTSKVEGPCYCGPERRCSGRRHADLSEEDTDWDHMA